MRRHAKRLFLGPFLLLAIACTATAQTPANSTATTSFAKVVQFGVPGDAKYIFCDGRDCPARTTKTLTGTQATPPFVGKAAALPPNGVAAYPKPPPRTPPDGDQLGR